MRALFGAAVLVLVLGLAGSAEAICYPPRSGEDPKRYYECYAQEVENADKEGKAKESEQYSMLEISRLRLQVQQLQNRLRECGR